MSLPGGKLVSSKGQVQHPRPLARLRADKPHPLVSKVLRGYAHLKDLRPLFSSSPEGHDQLTVSCTGGGQVSLDLQLEPRAQRRVGQSASADDVLPQP